MNARRRNEYTFQIPFNSSTNEYGSAEIKTRLVKIGEAHSTGALPEDAILLKESSGILDLDTRIVDDEIVITTRIRDEAIRRKDFIDIIKNTLKVVFQVNLPDTDESHQERLSTHFWVKVQASPYIEWDMENREFLTDDSKITLLPDGTGEFVLRITVKQFDPSSDLPREVTGEYEIVCDIDLPAELESHRHEFITFSVLEDSPDDMSRRIICTPHAAAHEIKVPADDLSITVKALHKKTRRHGNGDLKPIAETRIPLVYAEPVIKIMPVGLKMPIPADSQKPVKIMIQLLREKDEAPVLLREVSWETKGGDWESSISPRRGITDDTQGTVKFSYTPPDLFYSPERHFEEKIAVYSGSNGKMKEIGALELLLAPRVNCMLEAEKKGLFFEPLELKIEPEARHFIKAISGTAYLPVKDPESGKTARFPVSHAAITLYFWNGEHYGEIQATTESDAKGNFVVLLPGLDHLPQESGVEYTLDPEKGEILEARLDEETERALVLYEGHYEEKSPLYLVEYELAKSLKTYRVHYCRQLATKKSETLDSLNVALKLMQTAIECTQSFEQISREQHSKIITTIEQMLTVIFAITDILDSLPGTIEQDAASISREIITSGSKNGNPVYMSRLIHSLLTPDLRKMTEELQHYFTEVCREMPSSCIPIIEKCTQAFNQGLQEIDRFTDAISGTDHGNDNKGDSIAGEHIGNVCALLEKTGAIIHNVFFILFIQAFLDTLAGFSVMSRSHSALLSSTHPSSLDSLIKLLGVKESGGTAGELIRNCFSHMVNVTGEKIAEKGSEWTHTGTGAHRENLVKEIVDSFDWFGDLAGKVIAHTYDNARHLKLRNNPEAMEYAHSTLISQLKDLRSTCVEFPPETGSSLDCISSLLYYVDWYVATLQSLCTFIDAPSLKKLTHTLDLLEQAFKSYFGMLPRVIFDAAESLHISLIYSISVLNLNSEEDA